MKLERRREKKNGKIYSSVKQWEWERVQVMGCKNLLPTSCSWWHALPTFRWLNVKKKTRKWQVILSILRFSLTEFLKSILRQYDTNVIDIWSYFCPNHANHQCITNFVTGYQRLSLYPVIKAQHLPLLISSTFH